MFRLNFWVRDKKESAAEIDYVLPYKGLLNLPFYLVHRIEQELDKQIPEHIAVT
jgi:hypothetical protein